MRITYQYGYDEPTGDITELCSKLVVLDILKSERYGKLLPASRGAEGVLPMLALYEEYSADCDRIWNRLRKIGLV